MPNRVVPSEDADGSLHDFVTGIVGEDSLRVEEDLGCGYVRIKSSEAERRQAIQDIRSSEDIVLEMLRNARDAGAKNIFLAFGKVGRMRTILIIDDGCGIPAGFHERIFQPRVTSKLDSAKLDKWGIHGRGMALYSIASNADYSQVERSEPGLGSSIKVRTNTDALSERADQSTFPVFERTETGFSMRGPKNILRTAAEFAFEHREAIDVYCGTETEIIATLYDHGIRDLPASKRLFASSEDGVDLTQSISLAQDESQLVERASSLGMGISSRSARRILDGEISPVPSMMDRLEAESFPHESDNGEMQLGEDAGTTSIPLSKPSSRYPRISRDDLDSLADELRGPCAMLADRYYMDCGHPHARQRGDKLIVEFDLIEKNS